MANTKPKTTRRDALADFGGGVDQIFGMPPPEGVTDLADARSIAIDLLEANPYQPRKTFDDAALVELADDIEEHGVLQPLLVRPHPQERGRYQIAAGERRWRAARLAGLAEVPCIERDMDDAAMERLALVENIQRTDLDPVEEAQAYKRLMERDNISQHELARTIHKDTSYITLRLRLLEDGRIAAAVSEGKMSPTVGQEVARIEDPQQRTEVIEQAQRGERVTVQQVKAVRAGRERTPKERPQPAPHSAEPPPTQEAALLNYSTQEPVAGLKTALGALDVTAVAMVVRFGADEGWSCAQLLAALEAVGDDSRL